MISKEELYCANMAFNPYIMVAMLPCMVIGFVIESFCGSDNLAFGVAMFSYFVTLPATVYFGHVYSNRRVHGAP
jgi:hypothetical protein